MHMQLHEESMEQPVRACGVEANCEPKPRAEANPHRQPHPWVSAPASVKPDIQSRRGVQRAGAAGNLGPLPHESSSGPQNGRRSSDASSMPEDTLNWNVPQPTNSKVQSDRPIVVMKPSNVGGAKGTTS